MFTNFSENQLITVCQEYGRIWGLETIWGPVVFGGLATIWGPVPHPRPSVESPLHAVLSSICKIGHASNIAPE